MSRTVLVYCVACGGTGYGKETPVCDVCLGSLHIAVDRASDGGVPDGCVEWRGWTLGSVPYNPLRLLSEARSLPSV